MINIFRKIVATFWRENIFSFCFTVFLVLEKQVFFFFGKILSGSIIINGKQIVYGSLKPCLLKTQWVGYRVVYKVYFDYEQ